MPRVLAVAAALLAGALAAGCDANESPLAPSDRPGPSFLLADVLVSNTDNDGPGSLRQAMADAEPGSTIGFDPSIDGGTITLLNTLGIDKDLVIEGPPQGITLRGVGVGRVITVFTGHPSVTLRNLTISGGRVTNGGAGGIYNIGDMLLENVLVTDNRAEGISSTGGGISSIDGSSLTIVNSTISGNYAEIHGGGIFALGALSITNSTITANESGQGDGLVVAGTGAILKNVLIAGNSDENCDIQNPVIALGRSLTDDDTCGAAPAWIVVDPGLTGLAALGDNGGPTRTHALSGSAQAIDGATECDVVVDQRYVERPQGAACDIGAFEFDDYIDITLGLSGTGTVSLTTGAAIVSGTAACEELIPDLKLEITLRQTQKAKRLSRQVVGTGLATLVCPAGETRSWSVAVSSSGGPFVVGSGTVEVKTVQLQADAVPAAATRTVKLGWERK
jgi:hypothetical protein